MAAPVTGKVGERVIAYVDHLGRLEGKIARAIPKRLCHDDRGNAAQARQARRPAHLARQPPHPRTCRKTAATAVSCRATRSARLILPNGLNVACRVIDMSLSGAAIAADATARDRRRGHHRQDPRTGGSPHRRRLRGRVHPAAAPRLCGRERHRRVNAGPLPAATGRFSPVLRPPAGALSRSQSNAIAARRALAARMRSAMMQRRGNGRILFKLLIRSNLIGNLSQRIISIRVQFYFACLQNTCQI